MTKQPTFETELAALKAELHTRIRAHSARMTTAERARYVASLPKAERATFKQITAGTTTRSSAGTTARDVQRAELDRRMFGEQCKPVVAKTPWSLTFGAIGTGTASTPPPPPRGTLARKVPAPVAMPTRGATPPSSSGTAHAADMDRRMGFTTPQQQQQHLGTRRERNALVLGVVPTGD